jgi:uncharacterized protein YcbX
MIGTVAEIDRYLLTGGHAESLEHTAVHQMGITGDRQLVVYDSSSVDEVDGRHAFARVSQKQLPRLALVGAVEDGVVHESLDQYGFTLTIGRDEWHVPLSNAQGEVSYVNEFGDRTPIVDMGDEPAEVINGHLATATLRLGRKSPDWVAGKIGPESADRRVAPLHVVFTSTLDLLERRSGITIPANRTRANLVIDDLSVSGPREDFLEPQLVGTDMLVGDSLRLKVHRLTGRCPVPGIDQETGVQMKDVQQAYRFAPRSPKPTIGVYAYPTAWSSSPECLYVTAPVWLPSLKGKD